MIYEELSRSARLIIRQGPGIQLMLPEGVKRIRDILGCEPALDSGLDQDTGLGP